MEVTETYKGGCLIEMLQDFNRGLGYKNYDNHLFDLEGRLTEEKIERQDYDHTTISTTYYRSDGTRDRSESQEFNKYEGNFNKTIKFASDGKTELMVERTRDSNDNYDEYDKYLADINGREVYKEKYYENHWYHAHDEEDDGTAYYGSIMREFHDIVTGEKVSREEFLDRLSSYPDEVIKEKMEISREELIAFVNKDLGIVNLDSIVYDTDLDDYSQIHIWYDDEGNVLSKDCEDKNGNGYYTIYDENGNISKTEKIITTKETLSQDSGDSNIEDSPTRPVKHLKYKIGETIDFDSLRKAISDRTREGVEEVEQAIVEGAELNRSIENPEEPEDPQ